MKPHVSRLPAALLAVLLGLSLVCVQAAPAGEAPFSDVAPRADYAPAVSWAAHQGLVLGTGEGRFQPERPITREEYDQVVDHLMKLGLENGYVQEMSSADAGYIPAFDLTGVPDSQ